MHAGMHGEADGEMGRGGRGGRGGISAGGRSRAPDIGADGRGARRHKLGAPPYLGATVPASHCPGPFLISLQLHVPS